MPSRPLPALAFAFAFRLVEPLKYFRSVVVSAALSDG
jgi:hypothetical protein